MAKYFNLILITLTTFFLSFCWLSFYSQPLWARYGVSALLSVILLVIVSVSQKRAEILPNRQNRASAKALRYSLATMSDYSPFTDVFKEKGYTVTQISESCVLLESRQKILVDWLFRMTNVISQDVFNAYKRAKKLGADKIVIFCIKADSSVWQAVRELPITVSVFDFSATRRFLKENDKSIPSLPSKKAKWDSTFFYFAFARTRAKHYLAICLVLLLTAIISFYPLYNCIVATVCFAAAIYCLVNKRFNPTADFLF